MNPLDKDSPPLAGKRIVVTRASGQAQDLSSALERMGAEVLHLPTVAFASPEDFQPLDAALQKLQEFDWILFTSQNAVRFLAMRLRALDPHWAHRPAKKPRVAVVGPATAEAAVEEGLLVSYEAKNHTGEALARELAQDLRGRKVLLPRSDRGDNRVPAALREAGAELTEVVAYRTAAPKELDSENLRRLAAGEADAIVFASPSAFHNLCVVLPVAELVKLSERVQFAAIGPTTARALRDSGVRVEIEANQSSSAALAGDIAKYYKRQAAAAPTARRA